MTRLTRRGALSLGAAGLGAAACATPASDSAANSSASGTFQHGVASGDPTQTSVILWTRVTTSEAGAVPVTWILARDAAFRTW